ncbi:MAG: UDP-N-acetylglucosamine 1-carboxyvinyltransferase [Anaeroplasmataceae bacterium]
MKIEIEGCKRLDGTISVSGSKNSALPIIAASLLSKSKVVLKNIPHISDVYDMLKISELFDVKWSLNNHILQIDATNIRYHDLDSDEVKKIRGSYYYIPIMLSLFKHSKMIECGGCRLGRRPIDLHLYAFEKMGCVINERKEFYDISYLDLKNTFVLFRHKSVGATINTLLLSMSTDYTIIINPSVEPEVMDLVCFLRKLGRSIFIYKGMMVSCKSKKKEMLEHTIISDRIEATTYMLIGALAGSIKVINVNPKHLKSEIKAIKKLGAGVVINNNQVYVYKRKIKGLILKAKEYPKLSTDVQPLFCGVLAYANSMSKIRDYVFKTRYSIIDELQIMGINAIKEEYGVKIFPVKSLKGKRVYAHDLRCGAGLIIAASMAKGKTIIENSEVIDRGYENIVSKMKMVGLRIKKLSK